MKHSCRYLLIFGIVYTLGIWGFSYYYFDSQVKKMEALFALANEARQTGKNDMIYLRQAADLIEKGFYRNNLKAAGICEGMVKYFTNQHIFELALVWNKIEERILVQSDDEDLLLYVYGSFGYLYLQLKNYDSSSEYLDKSIQILNMYQAENNNLHTKFGNETSGNLFFMRGKCSYFQGHYIESKRHLEKSMDFLNLISENKKYYLRAGNISFYLGCNEMNLENITEAEENFLRASDLFSKVDNSLQYTAPVNLYLAEIYRKQMKIDLFEKYYKLVISSLNSGIYDFADYQIIKSLK